MHMCIQPRTFPIMTGWCSSMSCVRIMDDLPVCPFETAKCPLPCCDF